MTVRKRLAELGLHLPEPPEPRGEYVAAVVHGGIAYVSGQVSREGQQVIAGPVTPDTPPAIVAQAARACVLRALSVLDQPDGGLDRVAASCSCVALSMADQGSRTIPRFSTKHPSYC